jgi:hypothetical protein
MCFIHAIAVQWFEILFLSIEHSVSWLKYTVSFIKCSFFNLLCSKNADNSIYNSYMQSFFYFINKNIKTAELKMCLVNKV